MTRLNDMIRRSSNVKLSPKVDEEFWFSLGNQKRYIFHIAADLLVHYDYDAQDALNKAEQLVQKFYLDHVQKSTRKEY